MSQLQVTYIEAYSVIAADIVQILPFITTGKYYYIVSLLN